MDKLTGKVKDGLFTPINLYAALPCKYDYTPHFCGSDEDCKCRDLSAYQAEHPTLPIFDTSGIPVKDAENVEAEGPVWQW